MRSSILPLILLASLSAHATIVSDRIAATNRLLPLKKITVGPDDQYQGSVDPKGQLLVFTHKANLVPHLRVQDLKSGEVRDFLPLTADSQEPSFGPAGMIAFTYYKFSARGDICYADTPVISKETTSDPKIKCLQRSPAEKSEARSNPFWKSGVEIGYVVEDPQTHDRKVMSENIQSGVKVVLATGKVFSPSMNAGGRYLAYIQIGSESQQNQRRSLVLLDLQSHKTYTPRFSLPGISGFPAISNDETMLYFSHYPNDSNGDNVIDGSDNAVVFRIPIARVVAANDPIFPEQLTSLESSCSFPHPFGVSIYATCAFEGSLDIYQMPATGIIPVKWDAKILDNALATSRSYQERILNLNTEKYRTPNTQQITDERLLNNHILADETAAARSYLEQVVQAAPQKDKEFYTLLKTYLESRELKKSQPSQDVSRVFREQIEVFDRKLTAQHSEQNFVTILRGLLKVFTADYREAAEFLNRIHSANEMRPLERYLYFQLADQSLGKDLPRSEVKLLDAYHIMMTAPELDEEARVYYAFRMLDQIEQQHKDIPNRINVIESTKKFLIKPILTLLDSETTVLRLTIATEAQKPKVYGELDRLMSETRDDYFLRKALYVRAILNFTNAAQFMYMDLVATAWLKYTAQNDTEFIYARDVVKGAAYDQAYSSLGDKNDNFASSFFYEALSLTDDLEAHYGFVQSMVRRKLRSTINDRYKNLVQRAFIDDNMKFVEALLILIDQAPKAQADYKYVEHLDQAIEKLNAMSQDRDVPERYLLLGSCYLEKLFRTAEGVDFSPELMQKANRALMLAYDLGRDNVRIQASTLMNLGLLQSRVQNPGLAVRFLSQRKALGFTSPQEKTAFAWLYSRALFMSHQPLQAANEIAEVDSSEVRPAILERRAFYLLSSERYNESVLAYKNFFKELPQLDPISAAKIQLSYGYALLRNHLEPEAKTQLTLSIQSLDHLSKLGGGADRPVEFNPKRLKVFAYGFLAQLGTSAERQAALVNRLAILKGDSTLIEDQPSAMIEANLQIAKLTSYNPKTASSFIREAVKLSESLGKETGHLAHAVFVTSTAALVEGILHPEAYTSEDAKAVEALVQNSVLAYESQKIAQAYLNYQDLKLKVLNSAYLARLNKKPTPKDEIKSLMSSGLAMGIKESLPKEWQEVSKLSEAISL